MIVARLEHEDLWDAALLAVLAAAWTATPDLTTSRAARRVIRGGVLVAAVLSEEITARLTERRLVAMADSLAEDLASVSDVDDGPNADASGTPSPVTPRILLAGVSEKNRAAVLATTLIGATSLLAMAARAEQRLDDTLAARLAERGVPLPYTAIGVCWAAGVFTARLLAGRAVSRCPAAGGRGEAVSAAPPAASPEQGTQPSWVWRRGSGAVGQ